jgi:O-antigen/teichoic acid export membrane protein
MKMRSAQAATSAPPATPGDGFGPRSHELLPTARASRTGRNSIAAAAEFGAGLVLSLLATPIIVHHLGAERYGVLALATTFIGFMALLDAGMGSAVIRFLSRHYALGEAREAEAVTSSGLAFYGLIGALGCAAFTVLGFVAVKRLFTLTSTSMAEARLAFAISGAGFLFAMLTIVPRAVSQARQQFAAVAVTNTAVAAAAAASSVALVVTGFKLDAVVAANAAATAAGFCIYVVVARRRTSFRLLARPQWHPLRRMLPFSLFVFFGQVAAVVLFQLDRVVLGSISGVALVTYYVVPGLLAQRLQTVAQKVAVVLLPAATDLVVAGDAAALATLYRRATRLSTTVLITIATPLAVASPQVLRLWLGEDFESKSSTVLRLLVVTYFVIGTTHVAYYTTLAFARPRVTALLYGVGAILNVGLLVALVPTFGIVGAAVAYLVSAIPLLGLFWYVGTRLVATSRRDWVAFGLRISVVVGFEAALTRLLAATCTNLAELLLLLLLMIVLSLVAASVVIADGDERAVLSAALGRARSLGRPLPSADL